MMMEFQEKRRLKRFLYSRITLICLLIIIFFLLIKVWDVYKKQALTRDYLAKTAASLESLQAREKMLSSEIERLNTEEGTEEEIREKYGLVKPGEEVIVVVDEDGMDSNSILPKEISFWQKLVNWFN
jgi:cell division protein FtsB